jgi:O-antigen/teichoic acid export membrane protein
MLREDAILRRAFTNSAWLVGASSVATVLAALQGIVIARALGVEGFGTLGLVTTFVTVFGRLTSFRMNEFVIQYLSRSELGTTSDQAGTIKFSFMVEALAALLAFGLLWIAAPLGAKWFVRSADATPLIRGYAAILIAGLVSETSQGILQLHGRYRTCSLASTLGAAVSLVGVVGALAVGRGLAGVIAALVAGAFVTGVLVGVNAALEVRRKLGARWWSASLQVLAGRWRSVVSFVSSTNATATLSLIARDADVLWIGLFRGPAEAGLYRLAFSIATLAWLPIGSLAQSFYPEIARQTARAQWAQLRALLRRGTVLAAAYVVPVVVVLGALGPFIIALLYGREFVPAASALAILLVGTGASHLFFWGRPALVALHRPDYAMKVAVLFIGVKVVGVFTLLPVFGFLGAAVLATVPYAPGALMCVLKVREIVRRESLQAAAG